MALEALETEPVEFKQGKWNIVVVVSQSNGLIEARRTRMLSEAVRLDPENQEKATQEDPPEVERDPDVLRMRYSYAVVVPPVVEASGIPWPLPFDVFLNKLPGEFLNKWSAAVRRLNGHWYEEPEEDRAEAEKKAASSTGESAVGSTSP